MFKLLVSLVTILVSSQQDYDAMPARLRTALDKQPEEVRVNDEHIAACWNNVRQMMQEGGGQA